MVAATQNPSAGVVQRAPQGESTPAGGGSPGSGVGTAASGALKASLRGQSFAVQESALAPREKKRGEAPVQRLEAGAAPTTTSEPAAGAQETPEAAEQAAPSPLTARLESWRPALVKATDPVAFMTDVSYNSAVGSKGNAQGFFVQAIGELDRVSGEMSAFAAGEAGIDAAERAEVERLVALAGAWKGLYATIRDTGDNPADREGLTTVALASVGEAQTRLDALSPEIVGLDALMRMDQSLDDIRTFVGSWSVLAESGSGAAKPIWASFLQTTQRYRMILEQYGALEERGGEASQYGFAVKGEKGMARTREEADKAADESGGYMVLAMQSYSYKAGNQAGLKKQIDAMTERVAAGEFKTVEEAKAAGRREIGAGQASEVYYQMVDHYISAAWHEKNAQHEKAQGDLATFNGVAQTAAAQKSLASSDKALDRSEDASGENRAAAKDGIKEDADKAWGNVQKYQAQAEMHQQKAESYVSGANKQYDKATAHYAESAASIETAKNHLEFVDPQRRLEFASGVAKVEGGLVRTEKGLAESEERLAEAKTLHDQVAARAKAQRASLDKYDPQRMEVKVPPGLEGAELTSFVRGKLSVSTKIPGAPFIKIEGSAETEGGVKTKKGDKWGYLKNDWSLGMSIDLVLFCIKAAYVAGSSVEAKGKYNPAEVMAAGEKERSNYAAKREIFDSGAEGRLMEAFANNSKALSKTFGELKSDAVELRAKGISRSAYKLRVMKAAIMARSAQDDLWGGVVGAFVRVGSLWDALRQGGAILSSDEVYEKTRELGDGAAETAPEDVQARGDAFGIANAESRAKTKEPMDRIADYTNDPNVTFEDYGGWEIGAEVGFAGFDVGVKYKRVSVTSDGEGETYDFADKTKQTYSLSVSAGSGEAEISAVIEDGKFKELGIGGTLSYDAEFDEEAREGIKANAAEFGKKAVAVLKKLGDPKAVLTELGSFLKTLWAAVKNAAKTVVGKGGASGTKGLNDDWMSDGAAATPQLILGFDFELGDQIDVFVNVGAGVQASTTLNAGVFEVEAELTTGQTARFHVFSG